MRPWAELKPCAPRTKYVGVFDEQPMPLSLAIMCGGRRELPERVDDRGGDRVVAAAGAQRRHRALVVAHREAEVVLRAAGRAG